MKTKALLIPYLLIAFCAFGWAVSTIIIKITISEIPVFHLMAGRFLCASLFVFLIKPTVFKAMDKESLVSSFVLSIFLFGAYSLAIVSLIYTTASKTGFYMALSVVFVPVIMSIVKRKLPSYWLIVTVIVALIGMWFVSGINGGGFNIGDVYAILCALVYTGYILTMSKFTHDHPTYLLTLLQLLSVTLFSVVAMFLFENFTPSVFVTGAIPILTVGLIGTALATLTQTYAQQKVSPEAVGIILLGEPLFTLLMAVTILGEGTTLKGLMGAVLLLVAMLMTIIKKL